MDDDDSLLDDYRTELAYALELKAKGRTEVTAATAGENLANGRSTVPIDEYIARWRDGIAAMEIGARTSDFEY